MIQKSRLQSVISKYYLNGICEIAKWVTSKDRVEIRFISLNKDMVGLIEANNFSLKDGEILIYNTTKLNRLISITKGEIFLDLTKEKNTFTKLEISDDKFSASYSLASLNLTPKYPKRLEEPDFEFIVKLDNEDIQSLIRAKSSLTEIDNIILNPYKDIDESWKIEMVFGEDNNYSNKISYQLKNVTSNIDVVPDKKLIYSTNILKEIFYCNKDVAEGTIYIGTKGLMKLCFEQDNIKSTYWLVSKI